MRISRFITYLRSLDIDLHLEGDRLQISAPRGVLTAELREELADRKDEILTFLQAEDDSQQMDIASPNFALSRPTFIPLSYSQERFWFLQELDRGQVSHVLGDILKLVGPLNIAALEKSLQEILRRHETLRTIYRVLDDKPIQIVQEDAGFSLDIVDLSYFPIDEREDKAKELIKQWDDHSIDLTQDLMLQARLLRIQEQEHILVINIHHISSDGWSMGVFWRELSVIYSGLIKGETISLPELPFQYADYAVWQREWLRGARRRSQLAYWRDQLRDLAVQDLPTDRPRTVDLTNRGSYEDFLLSADLLKQLKELSKREQVTLFMILVAVLSLLLKRYSGLDDIAVGTAVANRRIPEIENIIGLFLNTLVLRTDLSGNPTFSQLMKRVGDVALDAYDNQDVPFEMLLKDLQPERNLNRTPYFQVMIILQNMPKSSLSLPGIKVQPVDLQGQTSDQDLTLHLNESESGLHGSIEYKTDLFDKSTIQRMLVQFEYLIEQIATDAYKPIGDYSLLTPRAKSILPNPGDEIPAPNFPLVTQLISSSANRTPTAMALEMGEESWTYHELNERASELARLLLAHGLRKKDVVVVQGKRSFGLITGMIGVLMAGGVLLTIDPNLPLERQAIMLREAGATFMVVVDNPGVRVDSGIPCIQVDSQTGKLRSGECKQQQVELPVLKGEDPAYIFFTSGTTGVPKGILGDHKGMAHFLNWQQERFEITSEDRGSQLINIGFDAILRDTFLPLISGATLVLPLEVEEIESERLIQWLREKRITFLHTVPSLAQMWLRGAEQLELDGTLLDDLRWAFFSGEPLNESLINQWRRILGKSGQLLNFYGPTETTMIKTYFLVPDEPLSGMQPAGRPLPNTQVLVLADGRLCGIGELGEIVIRTPFGTRGYINAPEEQRRFVKNPFREDENDLLFYTGDSGRYRSDGSLEVLGRLDGQVKIRGVRIEPAEIEAVLEQHPAVQQLAIAVHDGEQGKFLAAYIVPANTLDSGELRRYAIEKLPAAMVPSYFVELIEMPLMANGKVNRKALIEVELGEVDLAEEFVAPRTVTEETLVEIWKDVLRLDRVGIHDDFFSLGGHSLLAMQVISHINENLHVELLVRVLFEYPTVAGMAQHLTNVWEGNNHFDGEKEQELVL